MTQGEFGRKILVSADDLDSPEHWEATGLQLYLFEDRLLCCPLELEALRQQTMEDRPQKEEKKHGRLEYS